MQISRHWRLNAQRYRLEGFRHSSGEVSLQARPGSDEAVQELHSVAEQREEAAASPAA